MASREWIFLKILIKKFCRRNGITETKDKEIGAFVNFMKAISQYKQPAGRKKNSVRMTVETNGGITIWTR